MDEQPDVRPKHITPLLPVVTEAQKRANTKMKLNKRFKN